ncbi:MAG: pyridoxine 5'-phosphate synthase [Sulfitobacter sp.]
MTLFSLNINKIALLRNSRGGAIPDLCGFAQTAIDAGLKGLTIHPRADERHITMDDVIALSELDAIKSGEVEFNIEGDLRPDLVNLVETIRPSQFTVVPVRPGEVTSNRGWRAYDDHRALSDVVKRLEGIRIAVFCDTTLQSCDYVIDAGAHGVELYTGPYAEAFHRGDHQAELDAIVATGRHVKSAGLRLNGGHDLSLDNLPTLMENAPFDEFSIGHQVVTDALSVGWENAVRAYIQLISRHNT